MDRVLNLGSVIADEEQGRHTDSTSDDDEAALVAGHADIRDAGSALGVASYPASREASLLTDSEGDDAGGVRICACSAHPSKDDEHDDELRNPNGNRTHSVHPLEDDPALTASALVVVENVGIICLRKPFAELQVVLVTKDQVELTVAPSVREKSSLIDAHE